MTDEELDRVRAQQAADELGGYSHRPQSVAERAAELARLGWMPEDPLLKEARELTQEYFVKHRGLGVCDERAVTAGALDGALCSMFLGALKRGMELAQHKDKPS